MLIVQNNKILDFMKFDYSCSDLQKLYEYLQTMGTFEFKSLPNGLFPAAIVTKKSDYTKYNNVWVRDNIQIANALYVDGQIEAATTTVKCLMEYFKKHKRRLEVIIKYPKHITNPMNRPHVRFDGTTLEEISNKWAHDQNDALGYFLWFFCKLVNEKIIKIKTDDIEILGLFSLYFNSISYWKDEDSGHWEETRKISASSIGTVIASLKQLRCLEFEKKIFKTFVFEGQNLSIDYIEKIIEKGIKALKNILPAECTQKSLLKNRRYDGALLFLKYPLDVIENDLAHQIVDDVVYNLKGPYGVKRYVGDSYWSANYKKNFEENERTIDFSENIPDRDTSLEEGQEAQWCIFDPIISCIYGEFFSKSLSKDFLTQQILYLNRSLGHLTQSDSEFGELKCPEAYYIEDGNYVENDATPLLWTQANLLLAINKLKQNLKILKSQ